jgi:hypothetical protein
LMWVGISFGDVAVVVVVIVAAIDKDVIIFIIFVNRCCVTLGNTTSWMCCR